MLTTDPEIKQSLETFADQLIAARNLEISDPDILREIREDLLDRMEIQLNAGILASIPEHALPEFDRLMEQDDTAAIHAFISRHIPNIQAKVANILLEFRNAYLA